VREAEFFVKALIERRLHLGALVLNKVLPESLLDSRAAVAARRLCEAPGAVAKALPAEAGPPAIVEHVLQEVGQSFLNFSVVAAREAATRAELGVAPEVVATVPYQDEDIVDLDGLRRLGAALWHERRP
jgi:anion-transporting  ArsA/GET3 family ATPase